MTEQRQYCISKERLLGLQAIYGIAHETIDEVMMSPCSLPAPAAPRCHFCRDMQWDNRLIWSLEELLAWVRKYHMDQQDIRDHIDLVLGKYRIELNERQQHQPPAPAALTNDEGGNCLVLCQHCHRITQVECKDTAALIEQATREEREWWMLRVKAILQKTRFYDELDTALQELVQEAMDESRPITPTKKERAP